MTPRRRTREPAPVHRASPRGDAPEHPLDPADAAFLDPGADTRPQPRPSGYGDYEGERPEADERHARKRTNRRA